MQLYRTIYANERTNPHKHTHKHTYLHTHAHAHTCTFRKTFTRVPICAGIKIYSRCHYGRCQEGRRRDDRCPRTAFTSTPSLRPTSGLLRFQLTSPKPGRPRGWHHP